MVFFTWTSLTCPWPRPCLTQRSLRLGWCMAWGLRSGPDLSLTTTLSNTEITQTGLVYGLGAEVGKKVILTQDGASLQRGKKNDDAGDSASANFSIFANFLGLHQILLCFWTFFYIIVHFLPGFLVQIFSNTKLCQCYFSNFLQLCRPSNHIMKCSKVNSCKSQLVQNWTCPKFYSCKNHQDYEFELKSRKVWTS